MTATGPEPRLPLGPIMLDVDGPRLTAEDRERLAHPLVGGVILFARNFVDRPQLMALTREIKAVRTPQLLLAVDQEGGRVQRFRQPFTCLPAAAVLGRQYAADTHAGLAMARAAGWIMASELKSVGVDFSFAPVLDVAHVPSEVVGDRAFGATADRVERLATAWIEGMHAAGMAAVGKHFPGHGGVHQDSHHCVPCDRRSFSEIEALDLRPFARLAPRLAGIMTAHIHFPSVDDALPTYSSRWLKDILRGRLGFDGVIFSDDLSMQGAAAEPYMEDRVNRAMNAGCDMVLICNDSEAADRALGRVRVAASRRLAGRLAGLRGPRPGAPPPALETARRMVTELNES